MSGQSFNSMSRIGLDPCGETQNGIANKHAAAYMLNSLGPQCPMDGPINFALQQPDVHFKGAGPVGAGGCKVDNSSELLLTPVSKPKCRITLNERPFATVPYLGRGSQNVGVESRLRNGATSTSRRSVHPLTEVDYSSIRDTPMIPELRATIADPKHHVEGAADSGWIRGGLPSREYTRDKDYEHAHTEKQYI